MSRVKRQELDQSTPQPTTPSPKPQGKRDLHSWWKNFRRTKQEQVVGKVPTRSIFGVPLNQSIRYANVAISLLNDDGQPYIYGYVPIIIAKCGWFLKYHGTEVEDVFRQDGLQPHVAELKYVFDTPEGYGKPLEWTGYTVHDAASVLNLYLNTLPEPVICLDFYERFRDPLVSHQAQAVGKMDFQGPNSGSFDAMKAIRTYQTLITELPASSRQLLLYILDLLAVLAAKSDINHMTSVRIAACFQSGLLFRPQHETAPGECRLNQDVLIFLIGNQDHFLIGMHGTAADDKTIREVQQAALVPPVRRHPESTRSSTSIELLKAGPHHKQNSEVLGGGLMTEPRQIDRIGTSTIQFAVEEQERNEADRTANFASDEGAVVENISNSSTNHDGVTAAGMLLPASLDKRSSVGFREELGSVSNEDVGTLLMATSSGRRAPQASTPNDSSSPTDSASALALSDSGPVSATVVPAPVSNSIATDLPSRGSTPTTASSTSTTDIKKSLHKRLGDFFTGAGRCRGLYTDSDIYVISSLLRQLKPYWSKVPRTYIILRVIGHLNLLDTFLDFGFSDYWFPVTPTEESARQSGTQSALLFCHYSGHCVDEIYGSGEKREWKA